MRRRTCAYLLLMCTVAACSSSAADAPSGGGNSSGDTPVARAHSLLATDAQNGSTLTAQVGDVVHVRLGSTYWRFNPLNGDVVRTAGAPAFDPGPSCIPGGGCGTITQAYRAAKPGKVRITASRTTCGEALRCGPNQQSFSVTLLVRG